MVILIETSSRIEPLMPQIRKTGILFTQTVMGPTGEAAVVSFNYAVDKLQDFTTNGDMVENTITHLGAGTSDRNSTMPWLWAWKCSPAGHRRLQISLGAAA